MRTRAPALFDTEPLRDETAPAYGALSPPVPLVVLGSSQDEGILDAGALLRDGVEVRHRRGGGGAVLLRSDDCWIELWLPSSRLRTDDVRAAAITVGGWWRDALAALGVQSAVHRDGVEPRDQAALACFAGVGPGELSVQGRKVLGISQWRCREGVLVSSVVPARPPSDLRAYLAADPVALPALDAAGSMLDVAPTLRRDELAGAFASAIATDLPDARPHPGLFSPSS